MWRALRAPADLERRRGQKTFALPTAWMLLGLFSAYDHLQEAHYFGLGLLLRGSPLTGGGVATPLPPVAGQEPSQT